MALHTKLDLETLKSINWKRYLNTFMMVIVDIKVLGLIGLSGLTLYGIGWDTVIRPSLETMKSRDNAIQEENETLQKKLQIQHEFGDLEQKLANLDTHLIVLPPGTSAKIVSVTEAAELTDLATGKSRTATLPELQPPHNVRTQVELKPTDNGTLDIMHPNGEAPSTTSNGPSPLVTGAPPSSSNQNGENPDKPILVDRYNYDLSVTGTYPALMDLLNQLIMRKKLVKINKIIISKSTSETDAPPDAQEYPDYPLKLDMVISLSVFLYEDNNAAAAQ